MKNKQYYIFFDEKNDIISATSVIALIVDSQMSEIGTPRTEK